MENFKELYQTLKSMRFSGMAEELARQHENPNIEAVSAEDRIARLIRAEQEKRLAVKTAKLLKSSHLRYPMAVIDLGQDIPGRTVDTELLDYLGKCLWINEGKNLLVTGPTGTGKTYSTCAVAVSAINKLHTVIYYRSQELQLELKRAEEQGALLELINKLGKLDLLIIDDFGLMNLDFTFCRNLFHLIDTRDGKKSTVVVSQYPVGNWYDLFKDNTYADACLDRLTHSAFRLEFSGESLRRILE